jgi:peroxiredoxin
MQAVENQGATPCRANPVPASGSIACRKRPGTFGVYGGVDGGIVILMNPWSVLVRAFAGLLLYGTSALAANEPAVTPRSLEQSLRDAMNLPADTQFDYQDARGNAIDADAFDAATRQGNGVSVNKSQPGKLLLRLKKADAAPSKGPTHLPALEARDLTGRPVRSLDHAGKHTLVSFYFSTCVPCIQEVPALNAFRDSHPELNYLAITFDPAADARRFVSERKLSWPVLADAGRFLSAAGVRTFPAYMLVAPDGRILGRGAGLALHAKEPTPGLESLEKFVSRHSQPEEAK